MCKSNLPLEGFDKVKGKKAAGHWNRKKFLLGCAALTVIGIALAAGGIAMGGMVTGVRLNGRGFQVSAPSLDKDNGQKTEGEKQLEPFAGIQLELDYADVRIEASDARQYAVSYRGSEAAELEYEIQEGRLKVGQEQRFSVFSNDFSWFSFGYHEDQALEIVVYVPQEAELDEVAVSVDSGNISCKDLRIKDLKVESDYGDVKMQNVQAENLKTVLESGAMTLERINGENCTIKSEYGDLTMKEVSLTEDLKLDMESGDASCQDIRMRDFSLDSSYGNFTGENMVLRNAEADMESGDCRIADISFDNWNMETEYGNVQLKPVIPLSEYSYKLKTEYGDITINGENMGDSFSSLFEEKDKMITISCESGDIRLE